MKNTMKTKLLTLFLVLMTLVSAICIPVSALEQDNPSDDGYEEIMPLAARNCYVPIAGYGSTGRTDFKNIQEYYAMQSCMADPFGADKCTKIIDSLGDSRWLGWAKYEAVYYTSVGDIVIHFNYDGEYWYDDFKYKSE